MPKPSVPSSVALVVAPVGEGSTLDDARQQFQEQVDFFRAKLNLPTKRWDDVWQAAHDRAFMVAGAQKADLLNDLRAAVDKSLKGGSIGDFRKDFATAVQKSGWTGWTGEGTKAGEAWRTRVIYQTNMASSYAAGRWKQLNDPELLKVRPFWRYIHNDSVLNPRPQHKAWGDAGLTLRADHAFWRTHFPPNGWGCHCSVQAVRGPKAGDVTDPPDGWDSIDAKTGSPPGIDKGWAYAPGAGVGSELRKVVDAKVAKLPGALGQALKADTEKVLNKPAFTEAKTAKAAAEWAVKNNLADFADYNGIKPEVANAWNKSLFDHLQEFPELRGNQKFTGTCQGQFARWREIRIERQIQVLRLANPQLPPDFNFRPHVERAVKLPKVTEKYAHSWTDADVSGVAVNKKYGADVDLFKSALKRDVVAKWHPVGADTIRSVVDHELGHQLDTLLGLHIDSEVIQAYKSVKLQGIQNEVSGYADKNIKEFIAECWAEACNNPAPRTYARTVAEIVRARYQSKFGAARVESGNSIDG